MADLTGHTLGQYEILELIGRGGMANVYRAVQKSIGREVAVKVLPATFLQDATFLERFNREVQVIARLEHPRILPVHDFGEQGGLPFIVMRYLPGGSLADRIKQADTGMLLDEVVYYVEQIAEGLDFAHRRGIIHRDFKPSNVLLDEEGNAYLGDFGIAKVTEATAQLTGSGIIGTPAYMAPEMSDLKELTPLVDVYALGVALFQMVTGRLPYEAATPMSVLMAHVTKPVPDAREVRPDLPDEVQVVIERAMAKGPTRRYRSAGELAEALQHTAAPVDIRPEPAPPGVPAVEMIEPTTEPMAEIFTPEPEPPMPPAVDSRPEPDTLTEFQGPAVSAPPTVAERPAPRRGLPAWVWVGGGLLGAVVLVGVLALAGVFGDGEGSPALEEEEAAEKLAEETREISIEEPTATPTDMPITLGFPGNPVTSNDQWVPVIQEFNGVEMALVPAGCFMMGSEDGEDDERPVHEVCFEEPFWIDVYEVTNGQVGEAACTDYSSEDDQPRVCINWFDSLAHCEARGARLPTEAEREYAARGPDGLVYPWGNTFVADNVVYGGNDPGGTAPVGSKPGGVSWVGAFDLSGNVWEWVNDWYGSGYYGTLADGVVDPQGPGTGDSRVLRGGSWPASTDVVRAANRLRSSPSYEDPYYGFRCALSYEPGEASVGPLSDDDPTQTSEASSGEGSYFYDGFDDPELNADIWWTSTKRTGQSVTVENGELVIYSGTYDSGSSYAETNATWILDHGTYILATRIKDTLSSSGAGFRVDLISAGTGYIMLTNESGKIGLWICIPGCSNVGYETGVDVSQYNLYELVVSQSSIDVRVNGSTILNYAGNPFWGLGVAIHLGREYQSPGQNSPMWVDYVEFSQQ